MRVDDFDFELPEERIATEPVEPRDASRLLHINGDSFSDKKIQDLPALLRAGDLVVFNDTQVIPARLVGNCREAKVEVTLHRQLKDAVWKVFARPARKLRVGELFVVSDDFVAEVRERQEGEVTLAFNVSGEGFYQKLAEYGAMPLPPYMRRQATEEDAESYQTIFASKRGAVAAPTAGLHFTDTLIADLKAKGIEVATVTLHVGAGTFLPVKVEDTKDHLMHKEYGVVDAETAELINRTKKSGGRVVAVGTTSLRLLESAADNANQVHPYADETGIFITPGYEFKVVDVLLTNFHLPKSTLFMLVSAFSGLQVMQKAYSYAIDQEYRFYSYGDACLLERAV